MKMRLLLFAASVMLTATAVFAQPKIEVVGGMEHNWNEVTPKQNPLKTDVIIKKYRHRKIKYHRCETILRMYYCSFGQV